MLRETTVKNAFTVDVEDYYHVSAFAGQISRRQWNDYPSRVVHNTRRMLALLEGHDVQATFYILGWVAERFPQLVKEIDRAGHEIGCHSHLHRLIYNLTEKSFREDLKRSMGVLEDITARSVTLHRAPSFSITRKSLWALNVLAEEGIAVDSSIVPVHHDRYGIPQSKVGPYSIRTTSGLLHEYPPAVYSLPRLNLPVGGGGYFRLFPTRCTIYAFQMLNHRRDVPGMFYIHPWELDPDQPRIPRIGLGTRLRHYLNLQSTESKLHRLLGSLPFTTTSESLASATGGHSLAEVDVASLESSGQRSA